MPTPKRPKESKGDKAIVAAAGVDNTSRRTWDTDDYEEKAAAREEKVLPPDSGGSSRGAALCALSPVHWPNPAGARWRGFGQLRGWCHETEDIERKTGAAPSRELRCDVLSCGRDPRTHHVLLCHHGTIPSARGSDASMWPCAGGCRRGKRAGREEEEAYGWVPAARAAAAGAPGRRLATAFWSLLEHRRAGMAVPSCLARRASLEGLVVRAVRAVCLWCTHGLSPLCPAERDPLHQGLIVQRSNLRGRDFRVDLASRLGKTQVSPVASTRRKGRACLDVAAPAVCRLGEDCGKASGSCRAEFG